MKPKLLAMLIPALYGAFNLNMAEAAPAAAKKKEVVKTPVQMEDGRTVEFTENQKAIKELLEENGVFIGVRWDFSNGNTRLIRLDELAGLKSGILACHGLSQKGGDEYAGEKDVDDSVMAFDDLMDRLRKGEWSEKREGGFGGASVLAKAIVEVFGKTMEETRSFLRELSPAEKMGLRQSPELKPTIEKLEAAKAAGSKVDTAGLLAKLGAKPA